MRTLIAPGFPSQCTIGLSMDVDLLLDSRRRAGDPSLQFLIDRIHLSGDDRPLIPGTDELVPVPGETVSQRFIPEEFDDRVGERLRLICDEHRFPFPHI